MSKAKSPAKSPAKSTVKNSKAAAPKGARFCIDGTGHRTITKNVAKTNTSIAAAIDVPEALECLKGVNPFEVKGLRNNRPVNILGHQLNTKGAVVDGIIVAIVNGKPLNTATIDELLRQHKVLTGKVFTPKATWVKYTSHAKYYDGTSRYNFEPQISIDKAALSKFALSIKQTVRATLLG
jgi:hypothetical protein